MIIIGCDYHPGFQQIAFVDTETGELKETRLQHREQAEKFYRELAAQDVQVRVGMEASGQARWFERLLAELKIEYLHGPGRLGLRLTGETWQVAPELHIVLGEVGTCVSRCWNRPRFASQLPAQLSGVAG